MDDAPNTSLVFAFKINEDGTQTVLAKDSLPTADSWDVFMQWVHNHPFECVSVQYDAINFESVYGTYPDNATALEVWHEWNSLEVGHLSIPDLGGTWTNTVVWFDEACDTTTTTEPTTTTNAPEPSTSTSTSTTAVSASSTSTGVLPTSTTVPSTTSSVLPRSPATSAIVGVQAAKASTPMPNTGFNGISWASLGLALVLLGLMCVAIAKRVLH